MITQERLHALLDYDPETGLFRWRVARRAQAKIGDVAGWDSGKGMWRIEIDGESYLAHRLAWFYVHGEWPPQVDHRKGRQVGNGLHNLRPANNSQNQANNGPKSNNRLGIRGVSKRGNSYIVQMKKNGVATRRSFTTLNEAVLFAETTHKALHGEFSVFNREPTQK